MLTCVQPENDGFDLPWSLQPELIQELNRMSEQNWCEPDE